jgi:hypothetical protein
MAEGKPPGKPPGKPKQRSATRKQQENKREKDLEEFGRQVEAGSVVIRQMTPEERKANPPRERPAKRRPAK